MLRRCLLLPIERRTRLLLPLSGVLLGASLPTSANEQALVLTPIEVQSTLKARSALDTPAAIGQLDEQQIQAGKAALHVSESLAAIPGVQAFNRNNYAQDLQLSIRGFGARSTFGVRGMRIYVDGIPATMPDGQGQLNNVDLLSAERIEVLRGPYSALYGNSSGGVMLIETARGAEPSYAKGSLTTGSYNLRRYQAQASGSTDAEFGLTNYNINTNRLTLDGWRKHSQTDKDLGNLRLDFLLPDDSELTLLSSYSDTHAKDPLGLTKSDFKHHPREVTENALKYNTRKTVRQTQTGARYRKQLNNNTQLHAVVYAGERSMTQYQAIPAVAQKPNKHAGGVIDLTREFAGIDVRASHETHWLHRALSVTGGLTYDTMREKRRGYENFLGPADNPSALGVKGALRRNERNHLHNIDPYLQAQWLLAEKWSLEGGLRYSHITFRSKDHYLANGDDSGKQSYKQWLPVAALRYAVSDDASLYTSVGRGFETPTFNELSYRPDGNAGLNYDLKASTSQNYEFGGKLNSAIGQFSAALFLINTDNEIISAGSTGGRSTFKNAGKTRRYGTELSWQHELYENTFINAAYTWLDARFKGGAEHNRRIPGVAEHNAFIGINHAPKQGWQWGGELRGLGAIQANSSNTAHAAGYGVAAIYTGYALQLNDWDFNGFVRVDNLFDKKYVGSLIINESQQRYYEPAYGRNWLVNLSASYQF